MKYREIEQRLGNWISSASTGTDLQGITVRYAIPDDPLAYPCVIVAAAGAQPLEGGVRKANTVSIDASVISAANEGSGWQSAHKDRVAALSGLLDDTNTNGAVVSINSAQSSFTLYGWSCSETDNETLPTHQIDTVRISAVVGDRASAQTGTTGTPQDYSIRHEVEMLMAAHLLAELPESVTDNYEVVPAYTVATMSGKRIVASCKSCAKNIPQHSRWTAQASVSVVTPGSSSTAHDEVVIEVQSALRGITGQDFVSAEISVDGILETGHSVERSQAHLQDALSLSMHCSQN